MNTPNTNRYNVRNEIITLRALLKVACRALVRARVPLPKPIEQWLESQRARVKPRVRLPALITPDMAQRVIVEDGVSVEDLEALDRLDREAG